LRLERNAFQRNFNEKLQVNILNISESFVWEKKSISPNNGTKLLYLIYLGKRYSLPSIETYT
jgi:hypothetical protein